MESTSARTLQDIRADIDSTRSAAKVAESEDADLLYDRVRELESELFATPVRDISDLAFKAAYAKENCEDEFRGDDGSAAWGSESAFCLFHLLTDIKNLADA